MRQNKLAKWVVGGAVAVAVLGGVGVMGAATTEMAWADEGASEAGGTNATGVTDVSSSMMISPMNQQVILTPGDTYTGTVKVSNQAAASQPLEYTVTVGSFSQKSDGSTNDDYGMVDTMTVSNYNQMMEWIKIDEPQGVVQPNETKVVTYRIEVPEDAPAGGQYATLLFQNDTAEKMGGGEGNVSIQSKFQMASIIYADVSGETREEGGVLENNIPGFLLHGPLEASSMVVNDGNVHATAKYVLQVWPLFSNEEICTNEEDPGSSLVMPETKQYHVEECKLGIAGIYRVKQTVSIFGETSEVEAKVFLVPIWMLLVVAALILVAIVLAVSKARKRKGMMG